MAIEESANNTAIQDAWERLVLLARSPLGYDFGSFRKAADVKTARVGGPTAEACVIRCVGFLKTF